MTSIAPAIGAGNRRNADRQVQNVEIHPARGTRSTFCTAWVHNVERRRRHAQNSTFCSIPRPLTGAVDVPRRRQSVRSRRNGDERSSVRLSARNQLRGTVRSINEGAAIANVELDVAGQRLVASITVEAVRELGLAEGSSVTAVIKASDVILATD
jgi:molybdopterin-binding protein